MHAITRWKKTRTDEKARITKGYYGSIVISLYELAQVELRG